MMNKQFDLIIIGAGPGGYVAAIKAAQLGMNTALVERAEIGGCCLNRGCIPTKTLMHSSRFYQEAEKYREAGIAFEGLSYDYDKILKYTEEVIAKNRQGIQGLLKANGITLLQGTATILPPRKQGNPEKAVNQSSHRVSVTAPDKEEIIYEADKLLIATGSRPVIPRLAGTDLPGVITSDELLNGGKLYRKLLIIGGGVIGVEFATIYRDLGCEVEIIEAMDRILPNMDKEISQSVAMSLKKKGIRIHTKAKVTGITRDGEQGLICEYMEEGRPGAVGLNRNTEIGNATGGNAIVKSTEEVVKTTTAEGILLAVGRRAYKEGLFGEGVSVELEGPCIRVDANFETSIPGIYAIGDVIKGKQLAHAASAQGIAAVEGMCSREISVKLEVIPSCIYTAPEIAVVGLEEEEAIERGYNIKTGKYPMLGNSKTLLSMGERGFIKVISDAETGRLLGAALLCDRATDMVGEFASAIVNGLTVKELASVIRPHPTYSEAITEALEDVEGMAIHMMPRKR